LHHAAAVRLEGALEAGGALVAVGEVVCDGGEALDAERLRGVLAEDVHRLAAVPMAWIT